MRPGPDAYGEINPEYGDYDRYEGGRDEHHLDPHAAVTCHDCGLQWDPGYRGADRNGPPYEMQPDCPQCGGQRIMRFPG